MKWTLVRNESEWKRFIEVRTAVQRNGRTPRVLGAPEQFPALVSAYIDIYNQRGPIVVVATVNRADAEMLLDPKSATNSGLLDGPSQFEFNYSTAAHILTLVDTLAALRATTHERYEADYMARLAVVDQMSAEDRDNLIRQRILQGRGPEPAET